MRLGFLASGNGTSLRAIVTACETGELVATPAIVISNKREAPALAFAHEHGIDIRVIPTAENPDGADMMLADTLTRARADWIVLSGYLRKLGPRTLERFAGRILNIHPALLPKYGGRGFYGRRVHEAVIAAGERETGASVHLVDGEYDHGEVIAQVRIPVAPGDVAADLERKVMAEEPALFVQTLRRISERDRGAEPEARP